MENKEKPTMEDKRAIVLQKALEIFADKGYHTATTAEIAKAAGIAKGTLFNYFESKKQLLRSLVFETIIELANFIDPDHDGTVTRDEFFGIIAKSKKWIIDNRRFLTLYFSMISQPTVLEMFKTEIWEIMAPYMEKLAFFFQKEGSADPYVEVRFFLAILDGIGIHYAMDPENFPMENIEEKIVNYYKQQLS